MLSEKADVQFRKFDRRTRKQIIIEAREEDLNEKGELKFWAIWAGLHLSVIVLFGFLGGLGVAFTSDIFDLGISSIMAGAIVGITCGAVLPFVFTAVQVRYLRHRIQRILAEY